MNLNIKITGPAGAGMNSTAEIVIGTFAELGYDIIGDNEYQSIIKGGINYFDLFISDEKKALEKTCDIIISFNDKNLEHTLPMLKEDGFIIVNSKYSDKLKDKLDFSKYNLLDLEIKDKYDNTYLLGLLFKTLDFDLEMVYSKIENVFGKKGEEIVQKNKDIVKNIYDTYEIKNKLPFEIKKVGEPKKISFGNQMIADGAQAGGLEYYSAYPMTPASSIIGEIIKHKDITFLQGEDELAVMDSALGASFTGARSMVGSSGGGCTLMGHGLEFAVQAEFPIVMILSQRAGPSTGTPTFHEQGDINFALNPCPGESHHIVMCPTSLEETYNFGGYSLNLADKYQSIVVVLMDKQSSECHSTINSELKVPEIDRGKMVEKPSDDYKRYELTDDGISPRVKVGTPNGDFIATSYEHDSFGATSEDSAVKVAMTEKRSRKLDNFFEKEGIKGYEIYSNKTPNPSSGESSLEGKKVIITMNFTSYTAKEFVNQNPDYALVLIKFLKPLDERLVEDLKGSSEIIFVENNHSGQLENYITKELELKNLGIKISNLRKYDLFPFYYEDFEGLKK